MKGADANDAYRKTVDLVKAKKHRGKGAQIGIGIGVFSHGPRCLE